MGSNGANHLEEFRRSNGDISPKVSPYDEKLGMPTEQSAVVKTKLPMERFQQSGFLVNPDTEAQQGEGGILDRLSISGDQPEPGNLESSKNFVEGPEFEFLDVVKTQSLEEKGKQSSVVEHEQPDTVYQPVEERVVHEIDVNDDQSVSGHHDFIVEDKEEDTFDSNGCFCKDKNELDADKEVNVNFVSEGRYSSSSARQISASELSGLEEWSAGFPSIGLDHCSTAPIGAIGADRNSLLESHPVALYKSKTQKEKLTPDLKLDRLSEREKKKLIVNLVKIQKDGTVEVDLEKNDTVASDLLELQSIEREPLCFEEAPMVHKSIPRLTIAILVVGTRGDVQPFLAMAKRLQEFGHRVRLATHTNFREFVKSAGVEFYPLGGDPRVLAGYMARNKGFIPSAPGEISIQRKQLKAIIESLLPACTESDVETGASFRAQAIIANPPAYGHAHVAEALGIPLHMFFTMPWTPTYEFPHPLARVPQSAGNWLSYMVVDLLIWWGIRSYINDFRKRKLKLPPIAYFSMYYGSISHYPTGYMWSPHVVPKPEDWGPSVDVVGYCFLNLGSKYQPRQDFAEWIQKGSKPLYIGFGSMPLEDPRKTTSMILEALKITGQRGILDRGWGDLGAFSEVPDNIFLLENCPHDWLFPQCFAVVHHGGAGTTATGLKAGCPTTIVPFFGDQFFWADRIYQKGLGPEPIPIAQLSVESLSNAITFMLEPEVKSRVMEVAKLIENEDGVATAVDAFHRHLPAEMPTPLVPVLEDYGSHPIQRFFTKIGLLCCLPCS